MILILTSQEFNILSKITHHLKYVSVSLNLIYWHREKPEKILSGIFNSSLSQTVSHGNRIRWRIIKIYHHFIKYSRKHNYKYTILGFWEKQLGFSAANLKMMFEPIRNFNYHIINVIQNYDSVNITHNLPRNTRYWEEGGCRECGWPF